MSPVDSHPWRLIRDGRRDGPTQLALEEAAAATAGSEGRGTVRVYGWEPSTLTLGYAQPAGTVDWAYCREAGIAVTRRQTGGGGIYHDAAGDVAYTVVAPREAVPGDLLECYELLCTPILEALADLGVPARLAEARREALVPPSCYLRAVNPAHDIVVEGAKVSGNAQYRTRDAVIQHGSITLEADPATTLAVFADHDLTPADVDGRVTGLTDHADVTRADLEDALADALADWCGATPGGWTDAEREHARRLAAEKYAADAWVREGESPALRRG